MNKKEQLENNPLNYKDENGDYGAQLFYSNVTNGFCLYFNGQLHTYKTYSGAKNKLAYFVDKYQLEEVEEEVV